MEFAEYRQVPASLQQQLIAKAAKGIKVSFTAIELTFLLTFLVCLIADERLCKRARYVRIFPRPLLTSVPIPFAPII